jgi:hypothetical protein
MQGFAAASVFTRAELIDFEAATRLVARLPERDSKDRLIRCHEVVRALKGILPSPLGTWFLQDGHYRTVNHTWLMNNQGHILDLYSVARFPMVQLLDADIHFHRNDLFRPGPVRKDIRHGVVQALFRAASRPRLDQQAAAR